MPELPEVETVVRGLREPLTGHVIQGMWHDWARTIHSPPPAEFAARATGQQVRGVQRRGKYILIELDHDVLMVHLKMSGRLYVVDKDARRGADRWVHVRFDLDGGKQLRFSDTRKFGRVYLTDDTAKLLGHLGPEPLNKTFTPALLAEGLHRRKGMMKPLLLNQSFVAGIGNIYADEALFLAGIHPTARAHQLTAADIESLHSSIVDSLRAGIKHEGASIHWYRKADGGRGFSQRYFYVYGRESQPCKRCGGIIDKIRIAQRGTHYCPNCQPERLG